MLTAVLLLVRSQMRWRAWVAISALIAVLGGMATGVAVGARRTDTAYPRFLASSNAGDVLVSGPRTASNGDARAFLEKVERLPRVADAAFARFTLMAFETDSGRRLGFNDISPIVVDDRRLGSSVDRFKVLEGRLADPSRSDEVVASFPLKGTLGLHPGTRLTIHLIRGQDFAAALRSGIPDPDPLAFARGSSIPVHVVGIVASPVPGDFPPKNQGNSPAIYLTPAFGRTHGTSLVGFSGLVVKLVHGPAELAAFKRDAERLAGTEVNFVTSQDHVAAVQASLHLEAEAFALLALLGAVAFLLVVGQAVTRRVLLEAGDNRTLAALGLTRPQLVAAAVARAAAAGVVGALFAVIVAVLLSPLMPVGLAGIAEPDPGFAIDVPVLAIAGASIALLVPLVALLPAWRSLVSDARPATVSPLSNATARVSDFAARSSLPPSASAGFQFALGPARGQLPTPVRSAIVGCLLAIATVTAAITFSSSLQSLLSTPRLYGWNWDTELNSLLTTQNVTARLNALHSVAATARGSEGEVSLGGERVDGFAMEAMKGSLAPVVVDGRPPSADDEVLLGKKVLPSASLGDTVQLQVGTSRREVRLVGRGVLPSGGASKNEQLGGGAWLTYQGLHALLGDRTPPVDTFLVRYGPDRERAQNDVAAAMGNRSDLFAPQPPMVDFGNVDVLPLIIGGILGAAGLATLGHHLVSSVRRRRHELAILKTLGFLRHQLSSAVAWQATTITVIATALGIPLGIAAGRWSWALFADQQGLVVDPNVPILASLAIVPAALVLANIIAAVPGRLAAATRAADLLRTE